MPSHKNTLYPDDDGKKKKKKKKKKAATGDDAVEMRALTADVEAGLGSGSNSSSSKQRKAQKLSPEQLQQRAIAREQRRAARRARRQEQAALEHEAYSRRIRFQLENQTGSTLIIMVAFSMLVIGGFGALFLHMNARIKGVSRDAEVAQSNLLVSVNEMVGEIKDVRAEERAATNIGNGGDGSGGLTRHNTGVATFKFGQPMCDVWCQGPILDAVQRQRVFTDPKTFVDMPLLVSPARALADWHDMKVHNEATVLEFLKTHFLSANADVVSMIPSDYRATPKLVSKLRDPKFRDFARELNEVWLTLGRETAPRVHEHPSLSSLLPLAHPFIASGGRYRESYYWDAYFIVRGLLATDMAATARGMVNNVLQQIAEYGFVPACNRRYSLNRSAPPFATMMVDEMYEWMMQHEPEAEAAAFLKTSIDLLDREYNWWMKYRVIKTGTGRLNRYAALAHEPRAEAYMDDIEAANLWHAFNVETRPDGEPEPIRQQRDEEVRVYSQLTSAFESGWAFSSRWMKDGKNLYSANAVDIIPVDLNAYMYRIERTLERLHTALGQTRHALFYKTQHSTRLVTMQTHLYDKEHHQWRDFNHVTNTRGPLNVLSNWLPIWAGMCDNPATVPLTAVIKAFHLSKLSGKGGLAVTDNTHSTDHLWDYPNAWAPMQLLITEGFHMLAAPSAQKFALHLARTWLDSVYVNFEKTRQLYDHYDSTKIGAHGTGHEGSLTSKDTPMGYGVTNAVALTLLDMVGEKLEMSGRAMPAPCTLWCHGKMLHAVAKSGLVDTSKDFVDRPLLPGVTVAGAKAAFDKITDFSNNLQLASWLDAHFGLVKQEMEQHQPGDYHDNPALFSTIYDDAYTGFAEEINDLWFPLTAVTRDAVHEQPDRFSFIPMQYPVVRATAVSGEVRYVDLLWTVRGLLVCDMPQTALAQIENMLSLVDDYGFVPASNRKYKLNVSGPPLLAVAVHEFWKYVTTDMPSFDSRTWLKRVLPVLHREYTWWMSHRVRRIESRNVTPARAWTMNQYIAHTVHPRADQYSFDQELRDLAFSHGFLQTDGSSGSKSDEFYTDLNSAEESGWYMSARWLENRRNVSTIDTDNVVPVCLNTYLLRVETVLEELYDFAGDDEMAERMKEAKDDRKAAINDLMWDPSSSQWRDYTVALLPDGRAEGRWAPLGFLSNFLPLWAGVVDPRIQTSVQQIVVAFKQAGLLLDGGTSTSSARFVDVEASWDFPNVQPTVLQLIVEGMRNYGGPDGQEVAYTMASVFVQSAWRGYAKSKRIFDKYDATELGQRGYYGIDGDPDDVDYQQPYGNAPVNGVILLFLQQYGARLDSQAWSQRQLEGPVGCNIWCAGKMLETMMNSQLGIFHSSLAFVNLPLKHTVTVEAALNAFDAIDTAETDQLLAFLNTNFQLPASGSITEMELLRRELDDHDPAVARFHPFEFVHRPAFLDDVRDLELRQFGDDVHDLWTTLARRTRAEVKNFPQQHSAISLDHPYITSSSGMDEQTYFDGYFNFRGLLTSGMFEMAHGMVDNVLQLIEKFGFVPLGNRKYLLNRSNPPLAAIMVGEIYDWMLLHAPSIDETAFLKRALPLLEREHGWWMTNRVVSVVDPVAVARNPQTAVRYTLNRYKVAVEKPRAEAWHFDTIALNHAKENGVADDGDATFFSNMASAEESGWEFSTRWYKDGKTMNTINTSKIVPVCLNSYMYKAERTIMRLYNIIGDRVRSEQYQGYAARRLQAMNNLLWSDEHQQWLDYQDADQVQGELLAKGRPGYVSNFLPLWAGAYNDAAKVGFAGRSEDGDLYVDVNKILDALEQSKLLRVGGLAVSAFSDVPDKTRDPDTWDGPNVMPSMTLLMSEGLRRVAESAADVSLANRAHQWAFNIGARFVQTVHLGYLRTDRMYQYYDALRRGLYHGGVGRGVGVGSVLEDDVIKSTNRGAATGGTHTGSARIEDRSNQARIAYEGYGPTNAVVLIMLDTYGPQLEASGRESEDVRSPCKIWCTGPILEAIVNNEVATAKEFVDRPLLASPEEVQQAFDAITDKTDFGALSDFLAANFRELPKDATAVETVPYPLPDVRAVLPFHTLIRDPQLQQFAASLNSKWASLGRRTLPDVLDRPERYSFLPLRHPFIVPGGRFREVYYWDSYWICKGLLASGMAETARNVIENLLDMVETYGFVPNGSRRYYLNRSQPPFLAMMVELLVDWLRLNQPNADTSLFLDRALPLLDEEHRFWMSGEKHVVTVYAPSLDDPHVTVAHHLNRYAVTSSIPRAEEYDTDVKTAAAAAAMPPNANGAVHTAKQVYSSLHAAAESGMDFSSRWLEGGTTEAPAPLASIRAAKIIPVCLNSYLYKMETIMLRFFHERGDRGKAAQYRDFSRNRRAAMTAVMWDADTNQWRDYLATSTVTTFDKTSWSTPNTTYASNFLPLWAGAYDRDPASSVHDVSKIAAAMKPLLQAGGVATSDASVGDTKQQWDWPNAWSPVQEMLITALDEALLPEMAFDLAQKWVASNYKGWAAPAPAAGTAPAPTGDTPQKSGEVMFEKYDATQPGVRGTGGEYVVQQGFGWTNGVALSLLERYGDRLVADLSVPPAPAQPAQPSAEEPATPAGQRR